MALFHRSCEAQVVTDKGLFKFSGAFQVVTTAGPKIVLPNKFADEIRNNPHMNFQAAISAVSALSRNFSTQRGSLYRVVLGTPLTRNFH